MKKNKQILKTALLGLALIFSMALMANGENGRSMSSDGKGCTDTKSVTGKEKPGFGHKEDGLSLINLQLL